MSYKYNAMICEPMWQKVEEQANMAADYGYRLVNVTYIGDDAGYGSAGQILLVFEMEVPD